MTGYKSQCQIFTDFMHIFFFLIDFKTESWHLTSSSYCWMAEILLLLWQWLFLLFSFLAIHPFSVLRRLFISCSPSFTLIFFFFSYFLHSSCGHHTKCASHVSSRRCSQTHAEHLRAVDAVNNIQITAHIGRETHFFPLPCLVPVDVSPPLCWWCCSSLLLLQLHSPPLPNCHHHPSVQQPRRRRARYFLHRYNLQSCYTAVTILQAYHQHRLQS